jgi:hypothetical protein
MEDKMQDNYFSGDIKGLIRPNESYNQEEAYRIVRQELIERM